MKKRFLSIALTVLMLISMMSVFCFPAAAATISFNTTPVVLFGGNNEYNIVWESSAVSIGYVTYNYNGSNYVVYDEENGVVRTDDKMHTVRIPQEHLDKAGAYTVVAQEVLSRNGYEIETGKMVSRKSNFKGYSGQEKITFGFISDSHLLYYDTAKWDSMLKSIKTVVEDYMSAPDVIVMAGDITNELIKEKEFYGLFNMFEAASLGGQRPIVYAVGNHEKRGFYSKEIEKYLTYDTGEFYGQINYGPICAYVVDIGEDKVDTSTSYSGPDGGVVDMERYYAEQLYYFQNHPGYTEGAQYTFTIGHGPAYVGHDSYAANSAEFAAALKNKGTDLHISGHTHQLVFSSSKGNVPYPVIEDGSNVSNSTQRSVLVTFENGVYNIKAMSDTGATVWQNQVEADANGAPAPTAEYSPLITDEQTVSTEIANTTVSSIPTKAGISTAAIKGASDTTAIIANPVVFDAGEYYSVVWQTTTGIKAAGYVDIQGIGKTYMDAHGGKLRTETTHSVRVPKSVLSGKTYTISSRVVTNYNGYGTYSKSDPLTFGPYVNAIGTSKGFVDVLNTKDEYTILAVANKTNYRAYVDVLMQKYPQSIDLVVLLGDMVETLNSEEDFGQLLEFTNQLTAGKCPVLLLRGENETKGEFAPYLSRIIRPVTPELVLNRTYHNFKQGALSVIGLDTAAKSADAYLGYYGYANFDKLRQEQYNWLKNTIPSTFKGRYNIVFANATNLDDCVNVNFAENFEKHGVHLAVGAGDATEFTNGNTCYSTASVGDANALIITCKDEKITVESVTSETKELGIINTADVTYKQPEPTPDPDPNPDPSPDPDPDPNPNPDPSPDPDPGDKLTDSSKQFKDIKNKWYKTAVDYMVTYGYMSGMDKDTFGPDVSISRGMFVTILSRVAGIKVDNKVETRFTDVKTGKYFTGAVKWAADNGIVAGVTSTEFKPDDNITREQLCSIITRFADNFNMPLKETVEQITFADANKISSYARTAVKRCQMAGIVSGYSENGVNVFKPKGNATRAESAQILYKFLTQA